MSILLILSGIPEYSNSKRKCWRAWVSNTRNYIIFPRPCANAMSVSHTQAKKVTWRHSMIYVKHDMQFQLINSIVNRQHVNTLEKLCFVPEILTWFLRQARKPGSWSIIKMALNQCSCRHFVDLHIKEIVLRRRNFTLVSMLLIAFLAMYSPDKCWSNSTPRYLTVDLADTLVPPQVTFSWDDVRTLQFFLGAKQDRFSLTQMKGKFIISEPIANRFKLFSWS